MTENSPDTVTRGYYPVNGLELYYEVHGAGQPLVLLHGGLMAIDTAFGQILPALTPHWQVIGVEQQAHGHTADIDRPMSFPQMADDTAALLRHLQVGPAAVFGYSDGGNVALGLAIRHPDLVSKLVVAGTNYNNQGLQPGLVEMFKTINPDDLGFIREPYLKVAPRPEDFPVLVRKVMEMAVAFPGWRPEELQALSMPALVMIGDADIILPEHAVEMYRLIPNARLAVLPNTDHFLRLAPDPAWVTSMLVDFLNMPPVKPLV